MDGLLLAWAGASASASAGAVLGYIKGKEVGREQERVQQASKAVDAYFSGLPHGDPGHWCTAECYRFPSKWRTR